MNKSLKIWLWLISSVVGIIVISLLGIFFWFNQQKKQLNSEAETFFAQFSTTKTNKSAQQLDDLITKLGFVPITKTDTSSESRAEKKQEFENINQELGDFLEKQLKKPTTSFEKIPVNLQNYLNNNSSELAAIRRHILNNELPVWDLDIEKISEDFLSYSPPSFFSLISIQKLLLLEIVAKNQQNQTSEISEILAASWKLNQTIQNRPDLLSQLLSNIVAQYQAGALRQVDNLPFEWQQRLLENDYQKSMVRALEFESWAMYKSTQNLDINELKEVSDDPFATISSPFEKQFLNLSSIDTIQQMKPILAQLEQENLCFLNKDELEQKLQNSWSWWNVLGAIATPNWTNIWRRAGDRMIDLELTQKVLQAKTLATQQGSFPLTLPNLESQTCPGATWIYQANSDGSASISFSEKLDWREESESNFTLPLNYKLSIRK